MKCVICNHGDTQPGTTTVTLERQGVTIVFRDVPAEVCENCGERYIAAEVTARLLEQVAQAVAAGVQVEVRSYAA